jgi:GcrA cell cycle regulator
VVTCCWPIGHPREKAFHFCDAASEPGRVYCTEHARIAYQPHTRRDAA